MSLTPMELSPVVNRQTIESYAGSCSEALVTVAAMESYL